MTVDKATFIAQAEERMQRCIDNMDSENAHAEADDILTTALAADPDFTNLVALYEQVSRWFS